MSVNLSKGQKVDLTKTNPGLTKVFAGLGWDTNKYDGGNAFDLDTVAFLLDESGKIVDNNHMVYFHNLADPSNSVVHTGDNLTGEGCGDDEQIKIDFSKIPAIVNKIVFTVNIHEAVARGQNFGQVCNAFIRIANEATNEELIRYDLSEDFSIETSVVIGELYKHNGEWKFSAIGSGFQGGLDSLCKQYGLGV